MRPVTFTPEDIIEAGKILQAEGRNITGFALRKKVGGGDANRLRQVWDEYQAGQSVVEHEPVAELPVEVAEEMKAVSVALTERIAQLTLELNDKAVRAAERRVAEVTRAAGEQTAQAERELADAAQTVDDLEETLDALRNEHSTTISALVESRGKEQAQAVELAQLRERLASTEKRLEDAGKKLAEAMAELRSTKEQHSEEVKELKAHNARNEEELKTRLDAAEKKLAEATTNHAAELRTTKEQFSEEMKELKAQNARSENDLQKRLDEAGKSASEAREAKAAMTGELKALKSHNEQLAALLAGKKEPEELGKTKK